MAFIDRSRLPQSHECCDHPDCLETIKIEVNEEDYLCQRHFDKLYGRAYDNYIALIGESLSKLAKKLKLNRRK